MTTNVPAIQFTVNGTIVPTEAEILIGVQLDMSAAFGGNLNSNLETPQGQMATTQAALIAAGYASFVFLVNSMDPAYASGRFQDAIGRFYDLTRNPPQPTIIQVSCSGLTGTTIPVGAEVTDPAGYIYVCITAGVIPVSGSITLPFSNTETGAFAVPSSVAIYQNITGWDSATFVSGVLGANVESTYAFESRRQATLAANSNNQNQSVLGAVLKVPNVVSAYVQDNYNNYPIAVNPVTTITGYITGTSLYVSSGTGAAIGQAVSGVGVLNGTVITGGTTSPFTVNNSQTVASVGSPETLQLGGVSINSNSLYVCVSGGVQAAVAQAIWSKKNPGCGFTGNTVTTVYDTSPAYGTPGIPYTVKYQTASNTPIFFAVNMKNNYLVPSNAVPLVQNAILNAFSGADGGLPAQIGVTLISSRYNAGITALGTWAQLLSVQIVSTTDTPNAVFTASISGTTMTVTAFSSGAGTLAAGEGLVGANITAGTTIVQQLTGTAGNTGTYQVTITQTAASGTVNGYLPVDYQEVIGINEMPVTSAPYIQVNFI